MFTGVTDTKGLAQQSAGSRKPTWNLFLSRTPSNKADTNSFDEGLCEGLLSEKTIHATVGYKRRIPQPTQKWEKDKHELRSERFFTGIGLYSLARPMNTDTSTLLDQHGTKSLVQKVF